MGGDSCKVCDGKENSPLSMAETHGDVLFKSSGLLRSKSLPLENLHRATSQCILQISKSPAATVSEGRLITFVSDKHLNNNTLKDSLSGLCSKEVPASTTAIDKKDNKQLDEVRLKMQHSIESCFPVADNVLLSHPQSSKNVVETVSMDSHRNVESSSSVTQARDLDMVERTVVERGSLPASQSRASHRRCPSDGACPPSGKLLVCGRRRAMEDTATIVPSFVPLPCNVMGGCHCDGELEERALSDLHFFAVYDGHGGSQASKYCVERLHQALAEELTEFSLMRRPDADPGDGWGSKWEKVMTACFLKMDKEVGGVCPKGECDDEDSTATCCRDSIAPENVGTTAVVAVVSSCHIIIANCGDSRAVLSRGGEAIPLSRDHKPNRDDETIRIEAAGGRVIYWDGYRVGGLLALSRAIGDRYLKRYVVSAPEVTCVQRTEQDECLILASDGLWDVVSNDVACKVARKCLATARRRRECGISQPGEDSASASVAALLVKLAYGRGSKDNISVVVIDLKSRA